MVIEFSYSDILQPASFYTLANVAISRFLTFCLQLAADVDSRKGHNDLDSNVDVFDKAAGGRFKRNRLYDYKEREKRINKNARIVDLRIQARKEHTTQSSSQLFQEHMRGTIEHFMRENSPGPAAMRNIGTGRRQN